MEISIKSVVALSTTEAELIAAVESAKEEVYLKELLIGLGLRQSTVCINCDSQSALHLATNLAFSSRTKHISVRDAFLVALHDAKVVYLKKIITDDNAADMFTKSLPPAKFEHCSNLIQLRLC